MLMQYNCKSFAFKGFLRIMKKYSIALLGAILLIAIFFLFQYSHRSIRQSATVDSSEKKLLVVASFYPVADFARRIGGDLVEVRMITPAGVEPHEYEPTPQDRIDVYHARIFLYNGNGVDVWADKMKPDIEAKGILVLRMADLVSSLPTEAHDSESMTYDPHVWLDPVNAITEVEAITKAFIQTDPDHASQYAQGRDVFVAELRELDHQYVTGLATCATRTIVTSHNAFRYLAQRYQLDTRYILGLSPDEEPSPQRMAAIADIAKKEHIGYIFFETLINPKLIQTLAREIGAQALTLNPLESLSDVDIRAGKDYISLMKENLAHLRTALTCQ